MRRKNRILRGSKGRMKMKGKEEDRTRKNRKREEEKSNEKIVRKPMREKG
jgi:hypothetical protein